jgi:methyl-accepting chemotaxis protein
MKNITFKTKMLLLMLLVLALFAFVGLLGIRNLEKSNKMVNLMYQNDVVPNGLVQKMMLNVVQDIDIPIHQLQKKPQLSDEMVSILKAKISDLNNKTSRFITEVGKTEKEKALGEQIKSALTDMTAKAYAILAYKQKSIQYQKKSELSSLYTAFDGSLNQFNARIREMVGEFESDGNKTLQESDRLYKRAKSFTIATIIGGFLILLIMMLIFIVDISRKFVLSAKLMSKLRHGSLTFDIPKVSNDEAGYIVTSIGKLKHSLREVVSNIYIAANNLSTASRDLSASSQSISQGASEQASSVEQVSSSMQQMAANVHQNTEHATKAAKIFKEMAQKTNQMVEAASLSKEKMKAIGEKISVINEIAFQTNILALNAAVEAARAGEHGKGFGVVAAEVGKLAERTKVASHEIENLVASSSQVIDQAADEMSEVAPVILDSSNMAQSIAMASEEQRIGVDQINEAIQQLNDVTQQNAAASEEIATSSQELAAQADQMVQSLSFFQFDKDEVPKNPVEEAVKQSMAKKKLPPQSSAHKNPSGVNIDLGKPDELDEGFEKF